VQYSVGLRLFALSSSNPPQSVGVSVWRNKLGAGDGVTSQVHGDQTAAPDDIVEVGLVK
jgi:hypothetical protein